MPLRDSQEALQTDWLPIEIVRQKDCKATCRNTFITSLDVNRDNVEMLAACCRSRWKIENESFNMLKTTAAAWSAASGTAGTDRIACCRR